MNFYQSKYFELYELVPPGTLSVLGDKCWLLFDPKALWTLDMLREEYAPCYVNTWHKTLRNIFPDIYIMSGWRPGTTTVGAKFSQHIFGRAFDVKWLKIEAEAIRQDIILNQRKPIFQYISRLEMTLNGKPISWLHFDVANSRPEGHRIQELHL